MKTVALIPARSGSKRIVGKNIRCINGVPLIAYTIQQAIDSNCFDGIFVSTNSDNISYQAQKYGAEVIKRPAEISCDESTDYEWVVHALEYIQTIYGERPEIIAILRPTSPFRDIATIHYGVNLIQNNDKWDSARAIAKAKSHPCKMWRYHKFDDGSGQITPLLPFVDLKTRCYDLPTQAFSPCWEQTGGLQVHRVSSINDGDLSGQKICGLIQQGYETIDLNTEDDWERAEWAVSSGKVSLPKIG